MLVVHQEAKPLQQGGLGDVGHPGADRGRIQLQLAMGCVSASTCCYLPLGWVRPGVQISAQAGTLAGEGGCRASSPAPILPSCPRAIVFVVDSVAFQQEVKDVAEFLYQVLVDSTVLRNVPALLIACNKQGTLGALGMASPAGQGFLPQLLNLGVGISAK